MKLAFFSSLIPYPLDEGGKTAQFVVLSELAKQHDVVFICECRNEQDEFKLHQLQTVLKNIKVYPVGLRPKNEKRSLRQKLFQFLHWELEKRIKGREVHPILQNRGFFEPVQLKGEEVVRGLADVLENEVPDLVQFDFIDNASLIAVVPAGVRKVLILHDLRSSSVGQAARSANAPEFYSAYLKETIRRKEASFLREFDAVVVFSEEDKNRLQESGVQQAVNIPFAITLPLEKINPVYEITRLALVGPGQHHPNKDALDWYCDAIHPKLRATKKVATEVIGVWGEDLKKEYQRIEGLNFLGYVDTLAEHLQGAVMLVPLRIGSGIRTKILDAFASGIPVITTAVGVEGIPVCHRKHCMVAEDPEAFIRCLDEIQRDSGLLNTIRQNAFEFVKYNYAAATIAQTRINLYKTLAGC